MCELRKTWQTLFLQPQNEVNVKIADVYRWNEIHWETLSLTMYILGAFELSIFLQYLPSLAWTGKLTPQR